MKESGRLIKVMSYDREYNSLLEIYTYENIWKSDNKEIK